MITTKRPCRAASVFPRLSRVRANSFPFRGAEFSSLVQVLAFAVALTASANATSVRFDGPAVISSPASATGPQLLTQPGSTRALAIETVTLKSEPFSPIAVPSFSSDNRNRITLFALNLDLPPAADPSSVIVDAQDGASQIYPLTAEYVGKLPECSDISFVVLRLNNQLGDVGDVLVRLTYNGQASNRVRVGIGHLGGGPPDDPGPSPTPSPTPGATHVIVGQVMDSNGSGLTGVNVTLADTSGVTLRNTMTATGGSFSFDSLATGVSVEVTPSATQLYSFNPVVFANLNNDENASFRGQPRLYSVSGRVTMDSSGLSNATVTCNDGVSSSTTSSDLDGNYAFTSLIAGRNITITVAKNGYTFSNSTINISTLSSNRTGVDFNGTLSSSIYPVVPATTTSITGVTNILGLITRTASGSGYGTAYAVLGPAVSYGYGYIEWTITNPSNRYQIGFSNTGSYATNPANWTTHPSNQDVHGSGPTFGVEVLGNGTAKVWAEEAARYFEKGTFSYALNDTIRIYSEDGIIKVYKNGVLQVTITGGSTVTPAYPLVPQISLYTTGTVVPVKMMVPPALANPVYVKLASEGGSIYGDGSIDHPLTPGKATDGTRPISPGATVYLLGNSYPVSYPPLVIINSGTPGNYITYRPLVLQNCPRHLTVDNGCSPTVRIDTVNFPHTHNIAVSGNYVKLEGFELLNSGNTNRVSTFAGGSSAALPDVPRSNGIGINITGSYVEAHYNVIHDVAGGYYRNGQQAGGNYFGNVTFNTGFTSTVDGPHGRSTYFQNPNCSVPISLKANFAGNSYHSAGLAHFYAATGATPLCGYTMDTGIGIQGEGVSLDNGLFSGITIKNIATYGSGNALQSSSAGTSDVTFTDSFLDGGVTLGLYTSLMFKRNYIRPLVSSSTVSIIVYHGPGPYTGYDLDNNTYWNSRAGNPTEFYLRNPDGSTATTNTLAQWQSAYGWDLNSTFHLGTRPSSNYAPYLFRQIMPYPGLAGWSLLAVYNYGPSGSPAPSVIIDLNCDDKAPCNNSKLVSGQNFKIVSLESGKVLYSGVYTTANHTFVLPTTTDDPQLPRLGDPSSTPANTAPEFIAAIIVPGAVNP